jgi:hypothetical protein
MDKQCSACKRILPLEGFHKSDRDGYFSSCKGCRSLRQKRKTENRTYDLFGNLMTKRCGRCLKYLPVSAFNARVEVRDGLSAWCRECASARNTEFYEKQSQTREQSLLRNYGLTQEAWDNIFEKQGECCAICGSLESGGLKGWHTDHIHETKIVRGILCAGCNFAIGHLKDDPERAEKLAAYLRRNREGQDSKVFTQHFLGSGRVGQRQSSTRRVYYFSNSRLGNISRAPEPCLT